MIGEIIGIIWEDNGKGTGKKEKLSRNDEKMIRKS